ncbi:MAG TPA: trypsin-like peptidase domain-containing protein [Falsiroseomonas sp.]|jgi:serine protease Do|nr:trypsin-like peptidase domain-containing protein [Falsiroseomonas sp.]
MPNTRAWLATLLLLAACDEAPQPPPPPPPRPAAVQPAPAEAPPAAMPAALRGAPDFEALAAQVMPAVVSIAVTQEAAAELPQGLRGTPYERYFRDRFRGRERPEMTGAGSGFIIDPSGLIVTANHVVGEATRVTVSLLDGTELPAQLLGTDELTDLAVLQVEADRPLPYVALGPSAAVNIGQWVLAAGNPFGLGGSVSSGIISALGRRIGLGPFDDFIQTDAPINPGNSGGPLFNLAGQVIGINTAIYSPSGASAGIGFATPSDLARPIITRLRSGEQVVRGWLGVSVTDAILQERRGALSALFGSEGPRRGALIAGLLPGGPAERAGLRQGDLVVEIDGEPVQGTREFLRHIASMAPGQDAALTLIRDGRQERLTVRVAARPAQPAR